MLPFVSLNAVNSVQVGAGKDLEGVFASHHLLCTNPGGSFAVQLEGSLDGTNWKSFGTAGSGTESVRLTDTLLRYVRANLTSISGGGTVTAVIASA